MKFVVDEGLDQQFEEVTVDYIKNWFNKQFIVSLKYGSSC
ncbi:hypothetical protein SAMN05660297_00974 [Natronincola peptidivorans]|uniref:Uncharacterized protein n=2 Tax=Natronincola peptidivorans TaxID=426128 RepID=A0A1I0AL13_9FIRM|nr:hypothetical protein SAMN05660297_00974 [Natronincola peptidivorans]